MLEKKAPVEVGRENNEAGLAQDPYCPEVTAFSSCELRLPSCTEAIPKPALLVQDLKPWYLTTFLFAK